MTPSGAEMFFRKGLTPRELISEGNEVGGSWTHRPTFVSLLIYIIVAPLIALEPDIDALVSLKTDMSWQKCKTCSPPTIVT